MGGFSQPAHSKTNTNYKPLNPNTRKILLQYFSNDPKAASIT